LNVGLRLLCHEKAPNYRKNKAFNDLAYYSEWPKVAGAVIKAYFPVVPVPIRCQMRMAMPIHGRHHRNVRRGKIRHDFFLIHRGPSWQPREAW
jgi:hypothetical protein